MATRKPRSRGAVRRVLQSGLIDAYALDVAALVALTLIGVSVYRVAPDWLYAYAGFILLLIVWMLGRTAPKPEREG